MLCLVIQLCPTLCDLMDCNPLGFSVHGDSPGKNTAVGCHALLQGIFPPRDQSQVTASQIDSLPSEPPGKSKNTGVDSLSLLQGIFPTQGSNRGLLHCMLLLLLAKSLQSCLTVCDPIDYSPPSFSVHGDSPGKNTGVDCHAFL